MSSWVFFLMIGGQGRIGHLHLPVCKAVGQTIGPGRGAHTVFRHIHPVSPSVKVSAAAQHHAAEARVQVPPPALLEVEPGIHIQVHSQCCGQTGECKHDGEQNAHQFLCAVVGAAVFTVWSLLPFWHHFSRFTAIKYTSL